MANVVVSGAYATDILVAQRFFYHQSISRSYELMLVLSTQLIGFSLGGLLRRFLVYPSSMIWPGALVNCALFNTLHRSYGKSDGRHLSREKFFFIVLGCATVWYFVPGYLWTGLSVFNWVCWIAPDNVVVNSLFGTSTGLGMGIFTFDWGMVSYFSNPLVSPVRSSPSVLWFICLIFLSGGQRRTSLLASSSFFGLWRLSSTVSRSSHYNIFSDPPAFPVTNSFFSSYLPISAASVFDNTGMIYNISQVITNGVFDTAKYEAYSPAFLPPTLALAYGVAFAAFTSVVIHTFC